MQIDAGAVVALALFAIAQTGALVYYAGSVQTMLRHHDRRIEKNETRVDDLSVIVAQLAGKGGIQL